jgi:hypothetical protein
VTYFRGLSREGIDESVRTLLRILAVFAKNSAEAPELMQGDPVSGHPARKKRGFFRMRTGG